MKSEELRKRYHGRVERDFDKTIAVLEKMIGQPGTGGFVELLQRAEDERDLEHGRDHVFTLGRLLFSHPSMERFEKALAFGSRESLFQLVELVKALNYGLIDIGTVELARLAYTTENGTAMESFFFISGRHGMDWKSRLWAANDMIEGDKIKSVDLAVVRSWGDFNKMLLEAFEERNYRRFKFKDEGESFSFDSSCFKKYFGGIRTRKTFDGVRIRTRRLAHE
ncbi:MAG: hypothetical protein J6Y62_03110 [Clostridia bacterium]|nr:hypothetical protein [Clostridia bacterium]